jgi:hypothetical protein
MSEAVIIGAGACIMQAVISGFGAIPGLKEKVELHLSQIVGSGRPAVPADVLARATILIEEAAPWQGSGTLTAEERAILPEGCVTVTVPTLHFNSLWPLMTEDPRNMPEPGAPYGRLPFGMGDRLGLRLFQTLPDLAARREAYRATDLRTVVNLARSHELEVRNCFAREQGCDVRVAAFVMSYFREKRLYYTHSHPTGELMYFVLCQLFAVPAIRDVLKLPYDQLAVAARHWANTSNVFGGEEAPIHPAVAAHFGLKWWRPDLRYFWLGQGRSFDEWIDFYLSYVPVTAGSDAPAEGVSLVAPKASPSQRMQIGPEIPVGPYLSELHGRGAVDAVEILAAGERIVRSPPVVTSELDDAIAPYGRMFRDERERAYTLPEAFAGSVAGAAVLGHDGLVLYQDRILADTFRSLSAGSLIASVLPDRLVLKADAGVVRRDLGGPHFCGVGGMWHDYGHWIFTTLPRLVAYLRLRVRIPALRLIVPHFAPGSFQAETLALLGIGPGDVVEIGATEAAVCSQLFVTNAFDLWQVSPFCRTAARRLAAAALGPDAPRQAGFERIYLRSARNPLPVADFDGVRAVLALRGFQIVSTDEMSVREQIALFRQARIVVGEHGSALANLFFAAPGTKVLELFAPRAPQPMYWSVASVCGLSYGYYVAHETAAGQTELQATLFGWVLDAMLDGGAGSAAAAAATPSSKFAADPNPGREVS